ncbi:MAG: phage tail tape measure protein, partial [Prevotella sp.]|nr:phage tail tape measure protein [Prevotella sp.]
LNVDGQSKVVDATASVEELEEAIGEVRKAADNIGLSKGWETMMLGVNAAMDVLGKLKGTVDDLANSYESWETAMATVNTMAGKDAAGLAQLTDQVSELSKTIPKAREELAEGLYQTISNGVPEADWLTFLEQSAKASVGGIADLGETVKVTSTVIKNYGLEWSQAGEIISPFQVQHKEKIKNRSANGDILGWSFGISKGEKQALF